MDSISDTKIQYFLQFLTQDKLFILLKLDSKDHLMILPDFNLPYSFLPPSLWFFLTVWGPQWHLQSSGVFLSTMISGFCLSQLVCPSESSVHTPQCVLCSSLVSATKKHRHQIPFQWSIIDWLSCCCLSASCVSHHVLHSFGESWQQNRVFTCCHHQCRHHYLTHTHTHT